MNKKRPIFILCVLLTVIFALCLFVACNGDDDGNGGYNGKAEIGFMSGTGGTIDDKTMSLEVGTTVETIDLIDVIYAKNGASYTVCEDEEGTLIIPDKKVKIKNGDNKFYVVAKLGRDTVTYTLNIWKQFKAAIYYYVDGDLFDVQTGVMSHTYLEDFRAPENLDYGIEFLGWDCEGYYVTEPHKSFHAKLKFSKTITVKLEPDGGVCEEQSVQVNLGGKFELPVPTREGYRFWGWALEIWDIDFDVDKIITNEDGKGRYKWTIDEDNVTLYALWI